MKLVEWSSWWHWGNPESFATIRRVEDGWVHYRYCDFTGRGNEMFSGNDSLTIGEFQKRYPRLRTRASGEAPVPQFPKEGLA